ncbi:hypothetical protein CDV36_005571 [Fusarium kuroshium]|uniref:Myb-like domain-containing protein n=1 Tax=Fusarium kuroshium TaxID=2010991 RepID=A0A3M2SB33_9HYPO|nr:hypothetical protein CDV36_005571 [Fusarium kuroshium]
MSSNVAGNSKWPDFRLASTLWSLMGSPSNGPDKQTPTDRAENHDHDREQHQEKNPDADRDRELRESFTPVQPMMDSGGQAIDGLGGFDGFEHDPQVETEEGAQDDDFGALEMFDSNAAQAPYSSQVNDASFDNRAPEAIMDDDTPSSQNRKSKRDKKERKKKGTTTDSASPQIPTEEESSRKPRKSKRKAASPVEIPDSLGENNASAADQLQLQEAAAVESNEENAVPATQPKRKRKSSDSSDGKQRKKRKPHDDEAESQDVVQGTQEEPVSDEQTNGRDAQAASFLRTRNASRADAIYDDITDGTPNSPSHARLQLREARSREGSAPANAHDEMDVDAPISHQNPGDVTDRDLGTDSFALNGSTSAADHDVENLAREAWNEHVNGQTQDPYSQPDMEIPTSAQRPQAHDVYDVPGSPIHQTPHPPSSAPKRTRSSAKGSSKKAKPTYFEKSPSPEVQQDGPAPLPSPSAMTPKPRARAKRATRRKKAEPQSSQPMPDGDEEVEESSQARRNRMSGFTQGRFSDQELGRIAQAVESYRVEHDMLQYQLNEMIHAPGGTTAGDEHAALWARIFETCPDRHRQKIINITRKKFHNFVARGTWTVEQDTELRDLIEIHGTKWSKIAGIINRHPEDLRDRYRNYIVCGDAQRKDAWDETEEGNLTQYVMEAMGAIDELRRIQPSRELLKKPYEELIDWQNISERMMRTRSRLQCITKWKAMNIKTHGKDKLVSTQPDAPITFRLEKARRQISSMPEEERYRMIMAIQGSPAMEEAKIPWQRLVDKRFRNSWHRPTQMLLWRRLKQTVPNWQEKSVRDCAQFLTDVYSQTGQLPNVDDGHFDDSDEMTFLNTIPKATVPGSQHSNHHTANPVSDAFVPEAEDVAPQLSEYPLPDEHIQPDLPIEPMDHVESSVPMAMMEAAAPVAPIVPIESTDIDMVDPALAMEPMEAIETARPAEVVEAAQPEETPQPEETVQPEEPTETVDYVEPAPPKATRTAKRTGMGRAKAPKAPKAPRKSTAKSTPAKPTPAKRNTRRHTAAYEDPTEVSAEAEAPKTAEPRLRKRRILSRFRSINATEEVDPNDSDSVMDDMEDLPARVAV